MGRALTPASARLRGAELALGDDDWIFWIGIHGEAGSVREKIGRPSPVRNADEPPSLGPAVLLR